MKTPFHRDGLAIVQSVAGVSKATGMGLIWNEARGNAEICVAVLDGPVDQSHPCFTGAHLDHLPTLVPGNADDGPASRHGTYVASIIFGQIGSPIAGVAPGCRGLILPVFASGTDGSLILCSQLDLARAILQAVEHGAHVINISGGQLTPAGEPEPLLAKAIEACAEQNVLVIAAAGNDGCECLHVPAALATVLSVGAMNARGEPLDISNWGGAYQTQGILAPGQDILGASPGGGIAARSGTSFATPIVSGIAALLLSAQVQRGQRPEPHAVRNALIESAIPCGTELSDVRRCLAGRINPAGALDLIAEGEARMTEATLIAPADAAGIAPAELPPREAERPAAARGAGATADAVRPASLPETASSTTGEPITRHPAAMSVAPSDCGCGGGGACTCGGGGTPQLIYALGKLAYDFGTEARRDRFVQFIDGGNPFDPAAMVQYLTSQPYEAESLIWTLNLDATPIYAVVPAGPYAYLAYDRLRETFNQQFKNGVEMVSIPGTLAGSVTLFSGQVVPAVVPAIRGMNTWATGALVAHVLGARPKDKDKKEQESYDQQASGLGNFLNRVYYDLRNLGMTAPDRALNYAATNAFQASQVILTATQGQLQLDTIAVRKSPVCRPDSECYDVEVAFFNPENENRSNQVFRFTVDVSDVIPVTIGHIRSWAKRA